MMRLRWLPDALMDIDEIGEYIANDNPTAADRVVTRIKEAGTMLADNPRMGRYGRVGNTRELVVPGLPYIVAYRVDKQAVDILGVIDARRQWPESFENRR